MKSSILNLIIVLTIGFSYPITNLTYELSNTPVGYTAKALPQINASILVPDKWFFNAEKKGNTLAYFITKEDYTKDPNGMYVTGFSINVFTNMGNNDAVKYASSFAEQIKKGNEVLLFEDYKTENFQGKKIRIKNESQIIQYLVFGNIKTNKMYLAYFESSIPTWDENEEFGKTIMDNLIFDPSF